GFDKIPLDYFNSEQVFYANTPEAVAEPTAAHVVILVLTALRGTTGAERSLRRGEWTSGGDSVANKTSQVGLRLGIVGMGSIGRIVARYLTALGMKVSYYNRNKLSQDLEAGATYVSSLDELLRNTDVLSVHVPLSSATKGLIGARELSLMPKGGVVINTSRGPLVDELALIEALKSNHVSTAALDVFDSETSEGVPEYFKQSDRVTITPHMACNLVDIIPHFECEMVLNLATFIQDGRPKNAVNGGW
ncbi:D-isomer specific 2-hydroxyacid dehydrogenase, partial [Mrakia frigida]|uniref:D-isomer specific 2-hydroxyacid dehydrogenase n=1 Tax=Mrakia frigida TaxID=29902 RepID=UPI003FCC0F4A